MTNLIEVTLVSFDFPPILHVTCFLPVRSAFRDRWWTSENMFVTSFPDKSLLFSTQTIPHLYQKNQCTATARAKTDNIRIWSASWEIPANKWLMTFGLEWCGHPHLNMFAALMINMIAAIMSQSEEARQLAGWSGHHRLTMIAAIMKILSWSDEVTLRQRSDLTTKWLMNDYSCC